MAGILGAEDSPASLAEKGLQELRVKRTNVLTALRKFPDLKDALESMKESLEKIEEPIAPTLHLQPDSIGQFRVSNSDSPTRLDENGAALVNEDYASLKTAGLNNDKEIDKNTDLVTVNDGPLSGRQILIVHKGRDYHHDSLFAYIGVRPYKVALVTKQLPTFELYLSKEDFIEGYKAAKAKEGKPGKAETKERPTIEITLKDGTVLKVKSQIKTGDGKVLVTDLDGKKREIAEADIQEPKK
jgi:hypothetical protein